MRYFIEVKAKKVQVATPESTGEWLKEIHLWLNDYRTLCGEGNMNTMSREIKNTASPVTCWRCLAILEKQGRVSDERVRRGVGC